MFLRLTCGTGESRHRFEIAGTEQGFDAVAQAQAVLAPRALRTSLDDLVIAQWLYQNMHFCPRTPSSSSALFVV
jgi:hypothetical protein